MILRGKLSFAETSNSMIRMSLGPPRKEGGSDSGDG